MAAPSLHEAALCRNSQFQFGDFRFSGLLPGGGTGVAMITQDYQHRLLDAWRWLVSAYDDTEARHKRLSAALERLKELHKWGDKSREEYLAASLESEEELASLRQRPSDDKTLEKLAQFLRDVPSP